MRGTGTRVEPGEASRGWWWKEREMLTGPEKQGKESLSRGHRKDKDTNIRITETMLCVYQTHFFNLLGTQLNYISQTPLHLTRATWFGSSEWNGARVIHEVWLLTLPCTSPSSASQWLQDELAVTFRDGRNLDLRVTACRRADQESHPTRNITFKYV